MKVTLFVWLPTGNKKNKKISLWNRDIRQQQKSQMPPELLTLHFDNKYAPSAHKIERTAGCVCVCGVSLSDSVIPSPSISKLFTRTENAQSDILCHSRSVTLSQEQNPTYCSKLHTQRRR